MFFQAATTVTILIEHGPPLGGERADPAKTPPQSRWRKQTEKLARFGLENGNVPEREKQRRGGVSFPNTASTPQPAHFCTSYAAQWPKQRSSDNKANKTRG